MKFTDSQNRAIESKSKSILVSAAAGSGKTTAMVARIIALIENGESIENMLVITFTKAAAADMREKITKELVELCKKDDSYSKQLEALPGAMIGTIDSWCTGIVKNYFYATEAEADYDIVGEGNAKAILTSVIDKMVDEWIEKDVNFAAYYESMISKRSDTTFKEAVYKIIDHAAMREDPKAWLEGCCKSYIKEIEEEAMRKMEDEEKPIRSRIKDLALCAHNEGDDNLAATFDNFYENFYKKETNFGICNAKNSKFKHLFEKFGYLFEKLKEMSEEIKDVVKRKKEVEGYFPLEKAGAFAKALVAFTQKALDAFQREKKSRGVCEYVDLERMALEILRSDIVGGRLKSTYKYVFVDEYQDVNELQDALVREAAQNNLFIVGDVKQSIYAFRGSEPDIFLDKYVNPKENAIDEIIEFNENFRSSGAVVDFCNDVFCRAMTPELGGIDYERAKLVCARTDLSGQVKLRLLEKKKDKTEEAEKLKIYDIKDHREENDEERMAEFIVNGIMQLLSSVDENGKKICEKDIAVLYRAGEPLPAAVYKALKKRDINAYWQQKSQFSSAWEIAALESFVKLLSFGLDETALAGYLLSPLCCLSEEQLYTAVSAIPQGSFGDKITAYAIGNNDEIAKKIRGALETLQKYGEAARSMTVTEILSGIVAEKQYVEKLLAMENGRMSVEILDKYFEYISTLKSTRTVEEYVQYLENSEYEYSADIPEDALKIITVHKSKGLEFPYVFLINCERNYNSQEEKEAVILDKELGLCIKTRENAETVKNALIERAKSMREKKRKEEEMRLLYVATTRAEKSLYMYAFDGGSKEKSADKANSFLDLLYPVAKDVERDGKTEDGEESVWAIQNAINYKYPYESKEIKTTVTGMAEGESAVVASEEMEMLAAKGTRLHAFMERTLFDAPFEQEEQRLCDLLDGAEEIEAAKTAHSKVGELLRAFGGKEYREQSFVMNLVGGELVQGIIDLIAVKDGKAMIIDYKLAGAKSITKDKYVRQINIYADAAEKILGKKVEEMYLYSFTNGVAIKVDRMKVVE